MADAVVVDTHVLLWHFGDRRNLSKPATRVLASAQSVLVSPIVFWEIAMLAQKDRIAFDRPVTQWANDVLATGPFVETPLTAAIAIAAAELPAFHGDPADRLIVATAVVNQCPLISKDSRIRDWARSNGVTNWIW